MSGTENLRQLMLAALLVLLGTYLVFKHFQRERQRRGPPAGWTGKGIDVTTLKPTLDQVRRSYPRRQPTGACFHRNLVALARRVVTHLAYFQERSERADREKHAE